MIAIQAKQFINVLTKEWGIRNKKFLLELIDFLNNSVDKEINAFHEFEFSLIEKQSKIRLLHLAFYQHNLSIQNIKKNFEKRETTIISIFQKLNQNFNCSYNLSLLQSFFYFNQKFGFWPIQFGLEYQKRSHLKIKVYLSIQEGCLIAQKEKKYFKFFCQYFNLNYKVLIKTFCNKKDVKLDTIAIDFFHNNQYCFKFYPFYKENQGYLYRVLPSSKIDSKKKWQRFLRAITAEKIINELKINKQIKNIIIKNKFKIKYLCLENKRKSIYFR